MPWKMASGHKYGEECIAHRVRVRVCPKIFPLAVVPFTILHLRPVLVHRRVHPRLGRMTRFIRVATAAVRVRVATVIM